MNSSPIEPPDPTDLSNVFATADLVEMGMRDALEVLQRICGVQLPDADVYEAVREARVLAANVALDHEESPDA